MILSIRKSFPIQVVPHVCIGIAVYMHLPIFWNRRALGQTDRDIVHCRKSPFCPPFWIVLVTEITADMMYCFAETFHWATQVTQLSHTAVKRYARAQFPCNSRQNSPYKVLNFPNRVSIPDADQKDRGLWGRECKKPKVKAYTPLMDGKFDNCYLLSLPERTFFHSTSFITISYKSLPTFE